MALLEKQQGPENPLGDKEVKFIGLVRGKDEVGDLTYRNIILTVKSNKIIKVEELATAYSENSAINDAVGWIDQEYYRE